MYFSQFVAVLDFRQSFRILPLGGECCEITELLVLRIYLDDKRFAKESLFINIWAGIAALLLQILFSSLLQK